MIPYSIEDGALVLSGLPPVRFPQAVRQVAEFDDVLVVRLVWSNDNLRNVYGVNARGETLWRIGEPGANPLGALYLGVGRVDDRIVRAVSSMGVSFDLDARTGKVISTALTK